MNKLKGLGGSWWRFRPHKSCVNVLRHNLSDQSRLTKNVDLFAKFIHQEMIPLKVKYELTCYKIFTSDKKCEVFMV